MKRTTKIWIIVAGVIIAIPVVAMIGLSVYFGLTEVPSRIVNFEPTTFDARADARFFYSIDKQLKYSDHIDATAPTLMKGDIIDFLVSPDGKKIAVTADGWLFVIDSESSISKQIARVDSVFKEDKPIGQAFYRDYGFQWSRDSSTLYLIKDQYYESKMAQLSSEKGELWSYDIASGDLHLVLKPFRADTCFFGLKGIYFSVPNEFGNLQLEYYDGATVRDIGTADAHEETPKDQLPRDLTVSPFFSFSASDYTTAVLPSQGVRFKIEQNGGFEQLVIRDRSYVQFTQGEGFKGPYYCSDMNKSSFLPGGRYLVLNTYCKNYDGQLLVDSDTGKYMALPRKSRAYVTVNTSTFQDYRITSEGVEPRRPTENWRPDH